MMRRVALLLVVILVLLFLLVVPVGMGATMDGVTCPDCALSPAPALCLALLLGLGVVVSIGAARQRVATTLAVLAAEGGPAVPERPPR
jgi:hypothetical protein